MDQWNDRDSEKLAFLFESGLSEQAFVKHLVHTAMVTGRTRPLPG